MECPGAIRPPVTRERGPEVPQLPPPQRSVSKAPGRVPFRGRRFVTSPEAQEHPAEADRLQPERSGPSERDPLWMRSRGGPVGGGYLLRIHRERVP